MSTKRDRSDFEQRVRGEITAEEYVRRLEERVRSLREEHRTGDDGAGSSPPRPTDRPPSRWVRLVGPWRRQP